MNLVICFQLNRLYSNFTNQEISQSIHPQPFGLLRNLQDTPLSIRLKQFIAFHLQNEALISFADGIVLVYSVTDRPSFYHLQMVINKVRRLNFKEDLKIIVVGTKNDKGKYREVSLYEGQEFAVENGCFFVETSSCIPKNNIQEIFIQVMVDTKFNRRITARRERIGSHNSDSSSSSSASSLSGSPPSPTRKLSSSKIYDSVRNFVQKKRRQSTSDYYGNQQNQRQSYPNFNNESRSLNRELSKSLLMF